MTEDNLERTKRVKKVKALDQDFVPDLELEVEQTDGSKEEATNEHDANDYKDSSPVNLVYRFLTNHHSEIFR
jgi:hypothetical protein